MMMKFQLMKIVIIVKSKWEIPVSGDLFFKSVEYGWCIANTVPSTGGLNMSFCKSEDILMRDSFSLSTIRPPYDVNLCMEILLSILLDNLNLCSTVKSILL
ncbi:hypothetical protein BCR32DRAFT_284775 [Anaeromyces robustus]|uniref:Uncharacterized protein n=1 Tax=Anaeromyces robustus TaxID=1754192 RepID=A0A1Y1WQR9_9FUNG|nr:hypothetical protein BCR32DRAFT_284775 [Anaeromyces robustus]|eukprot:ORX75877.1 hypothetical protein BCR32DRAFT_284775 [Anaeromyces robustus]